MIRFLLATVAVSALVILVSSPTAEAYVPPVTAVVVDPFRAPESEYGPGNRGLDYATLPGTSVGASADGVVTFAGAVAGDLFVTVLHPDGLRTSYGPLKTVGVGVGDSVVAGQSLGTTGDRLHFGVRRAETYLDPAALFDGAHLVSLGATGDAVGLSILQPVAADAIGWLAGASASGSTSSGGAEPPFAAVSPTKGASPQKAVLLVLATSAVMLSLVRPVVRRWKVNKPLTG